MKNNNKKSYDLKRSVISIMVSGIFAISARASMVRADIDYQYFRDFAENRGQFTVGSMNVPIYNKKNEFIGTMLKDTPMIDFSAASFNGVATLISPQYLMGVAHNRGYRYLEYGLNGVSNPDAHTYRYFLVDRNNMPKDWVSSDSSSIAYSSYDYHVPRLAKLVTEAIPAAVSSSEQTTDNYKSTYSMFVRIGSGTQGIRYPNASNDYANPITGEKGKTYGPYSYLTGGSSVDFVKINEKTGRIGGNSDIFRDTYGPMATYGMPGDSGSGLYGYNVKKQRWELVGTLNSYSGIDGRLNIWTTPRISYINEKEAEDIAGIIENTQPDINFDWNVDGANSASSTISSNLVNLTVNLANYSLTVDKTQKTDPIKNAGKTVVFGGENATLTLNDNIDQGAGALYFTGNYTVKPSKDQTWLGAGISIEKGSQVNWQVKNPEGDRLSKIGEGTLYVNGIGENKGSISVGDGTVVLNQQVDSNGKKQAFSEVGIVSGRSTVVLNSADQVDPNNIYFGFRGGRLDVNGNDITFGYIQNSDDGAHIVNHNAAESSTVVIRGRDTHSDSEVIVKPYGSPGNVDIYEQKSANGGKAQYFKLVTINISGTKYQVYESLGYDKDLLIKGIIDQRNEPRRYIAYNGYFGETDSSKINGKLNVNFNPSIKNAVYLLSGGTNLNGNLSVESGTLLLSGLPTPHAVNVSTHKDIIYDGDWINRTFNAMTMIANGDSSLQIGRNVHEVNANFTANDNANLTIGYKQGDLVCIRALYTGNVSCSNTHISDTDLASLPTTNLVGDVQLNSNSRLTLGRTHWVGKLNADTTTLTNLSGNGHWTMTGDSVAGSLSLTAGSVINLNAETDVNDIKHFNILTVNGNLSGDGFFNYLTNLSAVSGDKVIVNGIATGNYTLNVRDAGKEPDSDQPLTLLSLINSDQPSDVKVALGNEGGAVDVGAYRYNLVNNSHQYQLVSPQLIKKLIEKRKAEKEEAERILAEQAERKAQEEVAKLAAEKAQKEEAERLAAEKVKEEAAKLAAEKAQKEEAERLAAEKAKEEAAKLAAEKAQKEEAERLAADKAKEEAAKLAAEKAQKEEAERLAAEKEKEEAAKLAAEKAQKEEAERLAAEKEKEEAAKLAAEKAQKEEAEKIVAEKQAALDLLTALLAQKQSQIVSKRANIGLSELSSQGKALLYIGQNLDSHLLENSQGDFYLWSSVSKQDKDYNSDYNRSFGQKVILTQLGIDKVVGKKLRLGLIISRSNANNHFEQASGKGDIMLSTFYARIMNDGYFMAVDASIGQGHNQIDFASTQAKFDRTIVGSGFNLGKNLSFWGLSLLPSVGVRYYHLSGVNYDLSGAHISTKVVDLVAYNVGLKLETSFRIGSFTLIPEFSSYYYNASHNEQKVVKVNNNELSQSFGRYFRHEIGLQAKLGNWDIKLNGGYSRGNEEEHQKFVGLKIGYTF